MADTKHYEIVTGVDYPPHRRAEAGDIVSDLPKESVSWLLARGAIRPAPKPATKAGKE